MINQEQIRVTQIRMLEGRGGKASSALQIVALSCVFAVQCLANGHTKETDDNPPQSRMSTCIKLLPSPVIGINPMTGSGETVLLLHNQTQHQARLSLVVLGFSLKNSAAFVEFYPESASGATRLVESRLLPNSTFRVRMVVRNDWEDGEMDIDLANHFGSEKIGAVHIRRLPISVKLEGGERFKLSLLDGTASRLFLRNDDPISYPVSWRLVNGQQVCNGTADLVPKAGSVLDCTPATAWHLSTLRNLLKQDSSHDGYHLLLSPSTVQSGAIDASTVMKSFVGEASLDYYVPLTRAAAKYILIILLMIAGGVTSLVLSYSLPNKLRRLDLKDKLIDLAARAADLSTRIQSRLAVLVRLERSRLADLLRSRSALSPDFAAVADRCTSGIQKLAAKMGILEQMDLVLGRRNKKVIEGVPPTRVDEVDTDLQDAAVLLTKTEITDADLQAAAAAVLSAASKVDKLRDSNDDFGQRLAENIRDLLTAIGTTIAQSPTYTDILAKIPGPERILRGVNATQPVKPDEYVDVDFALHKMRLIRAYVLLRDGTTDQSAIDRLKAREAQLICDLQLGSWEGLVSSRLTIREMRDDIFPERLVELLQNERAIIIMDPPIAYERAPLEFAVTFQNQGFDSASAREELTVKWDFDDGLSGTGWTISHYFQIRGKKNRYEIKASFVASDGTVIRKLADQPAVINKTVNIQPSEIGHGVGERTRTEIVKLSAALLIAVFGLISGAQDQIGRLDILPGLIAVFLIGFSADSIKRLLTTPTA